MGERRPTRTISRRLLVLMAAGAVGVGPGLATAGARWPTDGPVRHGMTDIRDLLAAALPEARAGRLGAADYQSLADGILGRVETVAAHCTLPPVVRADLDAVLARIAEGARRIKTAPSPEEGLAMVIGGLDAYGARFRHEGWRPVAE